MDEYTLTQKKWLEERFSAHDNTGIYLAHQPIYGFRVKPSEPGHINRYLLSYQVLKALSHIKFRTFLDAGGGEGYKAFLVTKFWDVAVTVSDLSEEACNRARELFGLHTIPADLHQLPFEVDQFDVVLCSESLEHVSDYRKAVNELLRVTGKALIITVPHESLKKIAKNTLNEIVHGHIHSFNKASFEYLKQLGFKVVVRGSVSPLLVIPTALVDAIPRQHDGNWKHPPLFTRIYNALVPLAGKIFDKQSAAFLIRIDGFICRLLPFYKAITFVIVKDPSCWNNRATTKIMPGEIIDIVVPYHRVR